MKKDLIIIHTDVGSRGNPGPAACAFVAESKEVTIVGKSKFLNINTNNVAEYEGVILALEWLLNNRMNYSNDEVLFLLDSELVVKQLNGLYKIKKQELQLLNLKIKKYINELKIDIYFRNVPREQNKAADLLVNQELDYH
jgi:ribonuclease HI